MKRSRKKRSNTGAWLLLCLSVTIAVYRLVPLGDDLHLALDLVGATHSWPDAEGSARDSFGMEDTASAVGSCDLLDRYGSWPQGAGVKACFLSSHQHVAAAPAGEILATQSSGWQGEDPPRLCFKVVLISASSKRAVVDGRVVGVGDVADGLRVTSIRRGMVDGEWNGKRLTYELGDPVPVEFREEWGRRQSSLGNEVGELVDTREEGGRTR